MYQHFKIIIVSLITILTLILLIFFLKRKFLFRFIFFNILKSGIILTIVNFLGTYFPKITIPISFLSLVLVTLGGIPGIAMMEIFKLIFWKLVKDVYRWNVRIVDMKKAKL